MLISTVQCSTRCIHHMMIPSPLEQFKIHSLLSLHVGNFDFSITNSTVYMLASISLFLTLCAMVFHKGGRLIPSLWQCLLEMIYEFVYSLAVEQIGPKGRFYFPLLFTVFTFLMICNCIGMIPYSFTVTSHFAVTFGLSVSLFIGVTLIGFQTHGLHFLSLLLPKGAPLALAPLLVVLELVSYCFRALSLGVRLFANMMAGHTLVKIIAGFGWKLLCSGSAIGVLVSGIPMVIVFALTGLEIGVALLQAYVFTILLCIYLNDAINLH